MVVTHIIEGLTAFGTIAVAVAAIWGDWFRSVLAPARLTLIGHTLEGDPTLSLPALGRCFIILK